MCQREPLGQLAGRLVWRGAVKRHHGRRNARCTLQMRAPPVGDGAHLYQIRAPADSFFKTMNGHLDERGTKGNGRRSYASCPVDQAKGDAKEASTPGNGDEIATAARK